jgi:hypothetical protein
MSENGQPDSPRSLSPFGPFGERGNAYREHLEETAPHVLDYDVEVVLDGRTFERPVNYVLARVVPPRGVEIDPTKRPFVIVDPPRRPRTRHRRIQVR